MHDRKPVDTPPNQRRNAMIIHNVRQPGRGPVTTFTCGWVGFLREVIPERM
jgi:hypothetical protein